MTETRTERAGRPFLPATAAAKGLGCFPLRSPQSRAAARALVAARQESEAEDDWDSLPRPPANLAEILAEGRQQEPSRDAVEEKTDWSQIPIPSGKENTVRGLWYARINAARAKMARFDAERMAEQ